MIGEFSEADFDAYIDNVRGHSRAVGATVVFDVSHGIQTPTALQRKALTKAVAAIANKDHIVAHAVVTNSAIARGVLTAVNWFVQPPFLERVFDSPTTAAAWCAAHAPELDPAALVAHIEEHVPGFARLRW